MASATVSKGSSPVARTSRGGQQHGAVVGPQREYRGVDMTAREELLEHHSRTLAGQPDAESGGGQLEQDLPGGLQGRDLGGA